MTPVRTAFLAAVSGLSLTACADPDAPAGGQLDTGTFGNATMNNTLVQNGDRSFLESLNERFSAEVTPMVTFPFDSDAIDATAAAVLRRQADWIRQFPEVRFRVYGHTDLVGSDAYNRALGLRRARAVVAFLSAQGIDRARLEAVTSFGETQPLIVTQGRERRNRRTVTEVTGLYGRHPSVLNGKYAQVIFREYVESATALPPSQGSATGEVVGGD